MIGEVFGNPRYIAAFLALAMLFGLFFSLMSGLISLGGLELNQGADGLRIGLTIIISLLCAGNATVNLRNYELGCNGGTGGRMTALGLIVGIFVGTCPFCQPAWILFAGLGSATACASSISAYIGGLSVVLLLLALHLSLEAGAGKCEMKKRGR